MDEDLCILEDEYCPPVDPALVSAIFYDFAGQPNALALARELLHALKESAIAEQLTDFDASASGGQIVENPAKRNVDDTESNTDSWATQTTLSTGDLSGIGLEDSSEGVYWKDADKYTIAKKEHVLAETFPNLRADLIAYTLKKCADDLDKATDELLNHAYFEDARDILSGEGPIAKGIDAFSEEHHVPQRGKKGKNRRKQRTSVQTLDSFDSSGLDHSPAAPANRWLNTSRDVEFVTSRTKLSHKVVSSTYHENGASLSATILTIVRKEIQANKKNGEPDPGVIQDALSLNESFPTMDLEHALAVVKIADYSPAKAHDLAKALTEQPATETGGKGGIQLDFRYAPVNLTDSETVVPKLPSLAPSARVHDSVSLAHARGDAFQQASAAYRRGKSTPLMRQAAAYYAQEGRDLNANLKAMSQTEADAFVASQSGSNYLDLHGVTVANATRISKQRTQVWWDSLGERKIREWGNARGGVGEGYRIVTGLGRHSEGGRGKIGPAVLKALMNEGWKIEVGTGELLVTGHARRR